MKFEYGVILVLGFLVISILALVASNPNEVPHWKSLGIISIERETFSDDPDIIEKTIQLFKDKPEVKAFYAKYEDASVSVRDDHISYFAGSEDDSHVRMNLFFDENYELDHIDFHCYFQKEHQFELAQEDIATSLEKYDCKKYGT